MNKALIISVVGVAILVGCKRLGIETGGPVPHDGMTAAQYNWKLIAGYAWPAVVPFLRFIPVVGPVLQELAANVTWGALATKQQKTADKA